MPMPVDTLRPQSSVDEISKAISDSIAQCVNEGKEQKQCVAIAFSIARKRTGKNLGGERPAPAQTAPPGMGM